ncbi:hypothetical protein NCU06147 [Neurospora crassa OR74A]|uniref:Uncharacterized protein n=2 Tax=Neurospora crassa TaxID=5141 RepID=Q7S5E1_NEUCR|nr:hypothetical protein NCU06147 [Neurospora crassa OR74A]EAA30773.1 hypothetical protein NCU06147 [Neurospora crassa OR74A]DAA64473.1 TPA_inf: suppressor of ascus dominance 5 [Neurospora crassa]|eukprot:XP_960009.1 hypothetical protein NCU06147 [Neurospora crassa OR74A]
MSPKKAEPDAVAWPLFGRLPAEIQIMIFHEALRKPQVHFVNASRREVDPATWKLVLKSRNKKGDTSGYRLIENIQDVARDSPVAAEAILKSALQPLLLPIPVRPNDWCKIDAATDLVVFEFGVDKSGKLWLWHPRNQLVDLNPLASHIHSRRVREDLKGIRKVAFVYGGNKQPQAGSSESVFQCLQHHNRGHARQKFCPEELLGFIYQLSDIETVYFILHDRVNAKAVTNYAASYFSVTVPAATRNTFGLKTFYSTTRSYITVPLPEYQIGPVLHATWKTKDRIWPHGPSPPLVNAAREAAIARPPDSRERLYAEHVRKLSDLADALHHCKEVWRLVLEMIQQIRADQDTPLSPDWPLPIPPEVNTAQFRTLKQHHRQRYNLENFTKERRDNLEFGMLLMVDETAVYKSGKNQSDLSP